MAKRGEKPFHKIMMVQSKLGMVAKYGEAALGDQTFQEFMADVDECYRHLMAFRNIINSMVGFDEIPERAVLPYIEDAIREDA